MSIKKYPIDILIAEDDDDDFEVIEESIRSVDLKNRIFRARDGEELMDMLLHPDRVAQKRFRPGFVILDLNMPKKNGTEVLREMKGDATLRKIPVVVLTTSKEKEDVLITYDLGVNSFIEKPSGFEQFLSVVKKVIDYWLVVKLPSCEYTS